MKIKKINLVAATIGGLTLGLSLGLVTAPTPASCKEALQSSDKLQDYAAEGFGLAAGAIGYAVSWNSSGLDSVTASTNAVASKTSAEKLKYNEAAAKCDGAKR